jgi:hypothetical protein
MKRQLFRLRLALLLGLTLPRPRPPTTSGVRYGLLSRITPWPCTATTRWPISPITGP